MSHSKTVTIVSGLPRSGTSLMMQMLAAGGMPLLTDGVRKADQDNLRGYFEYEPVKRTGRDASWLERAGDKAVKVVYALLKDLPDNQQYRVILMRRDIYEVLASQQVMLDRAGKRGAGIPSQRLARVFERQMEQVEAWLAQQPNFHVRTVRHRDCIERPEAVAAAVNAFLGGSLDVSAMAAAVDPALYRQRSQTPKEPSR